MSQKDKGLVISAAMVIGKMVNLFDSNQLPLVL